MNKSNMDVVEKTGDKSVTMTADLAKIKFQDFKNYLSGLIRQAGEHGQPPQAAVKVRSLIQDLIDNKVTPEYFSTQIQKELNSAPQLPDIILLIRTCLPHLQVQKSFLNGELSKLIPSRITTPTETSGGSNEYPLAFLRHQEEFHQMKRFLQHNPSMLSPLLQHLEKKNPKLLNIISQNRDAFIRMVNEPDGGSGGGGSAPRVGGGGSAGGEDSMMTEPGVIQVSPQDKEAIERVIFSPLK